MEFFDNFGGKVVSFFTSRLASIAFFFLVLAVGALLVRAIVKFFRRAMDRSRLKGAAGDFLTSVVKAVLYVIYVIALLSLLGVPTTSLVAVFTAFSLAISLALQGTLSNVASGIQLIVNKPFEEGDFVEIDGHSGTVKTMTISCTKLLTPDNKMVVLPNGTVSNANIINYSTMETRRVELMFSASYDSDIEKVKGTILGVIATHDEILTDPAPMVRLKEQGDSSLEFVARVWVKQDDYWSVYFALQEEVLPALDAAGIHVPYNQMDVHIVQ